MMLEIRDVKKSFGGQTVLDGISLDVEKGDVVAILGPSGSGKTTFLRCLNFLEKADSGSLVFDGEPFDLHSTDKKDIARLRRKTGFVFQNYNLFQNKTVLQNVTLGLTSGMGVEKKQAEAKALEMLEKVGMADKIKSYPSQLSGGQQQRVAIARALVTRPSLILADEPTGNLDSKTSREIMAMLHDLHKQGNTIVLITHDDSIAHQAPRIMHILDGHVTEVQASEMNTSLQGGVT